MDGDVKTEQLRNLAAVMILGASEQTDELTDVEARTLIDRCLRQAEAAVDALVLSAEWPAGDAGVMIAEQIAPIRRFMGAVNALAGGRGRATPAQMLEQLQALRVMAEELPLPPGAPVSDGALSLLAHWPAEPDSLGFVLALLHVFEPEPAGPPQAPEQHAEAETTNDSQRTDNSSDE